MCDSPFLALFATIYQQIIFFNILIKREIKVNKAFANVKDYKIFKTNRTTNENNNNTLKLMWETQKLLVFTRKAVWFLFGESAKHIGWCCGSF